MANAAVENKETPVVAKEVDATNSTENGAEVAAEAKENGDAASEADEAAADSSENTEEGSADAAEENGDAEEANGDSTDSTPAEAVKRKVVVEEKKCEDAATTPEKKAKLDEATKEEVQNGAEASEVSA